MWKSYVELYFTTATILDWKKLLKKDKYKDIVIDSLKFLTKENRVGIYAFVIMPNHIHIVWHINEPYTLSKVQQNFLKFTAQQIKFDLKIQDPKFLETFKVDRKDREYQFWQEKALSIAIYNDKVLTQKINYIHNNPLQRKWRLVAKPEDYRYSSAYYYAYDEKNWDFLL